MKLLVPVAALCLISAGCVAPVQVFYDGPPTPQSKIAVLYNYPDEGLFIFSVDGRELSSHSWWDNSDQCVKEIDLLPGSHAVRGEGAIQYDVRSFEETYQFEAGKHYKLVRKVMGYSLKPELEEVLQDNAPRKSRYC